MITIEAENYNHISQDFYDKTIHSLELNRLSCTCGLSGVLVFHGSYRRRVQLRDEVLTLVVARVRCSACGHTHALLLSSLVPYSQIPLLLQVDAVASLEKGTPPLQILQEQCYVDESNLRAVIRSYRLHWRERLLSEGIPVTSPALLVRMCFLHFSRNFMQIKNTRNKLFPLPT